MVFETPTQFLILALVLFAGWIFGLASHPGGKKWKQKLRDEEAAHKATRDELSNLRSEQDARVKQLEADHATRIRELEADRDSARKAASAHGAPVAAGAAGVAAGAAATHAASGERRSGWRGWFGWDRDNLSRIDGIDEATERALVGDGVKSFEQVASLSDADAHALEERLGFGRGRIAEQRWREQARTLVDDHERDLAARDYGVGRG